MMRALAARSGLGSMAAHTYRFFCRDFAATSIVARDGAELVGFVTAYQRQRSLDTLLVWQIVVSLAHRRRGMGRAMFASLQHRVRASGVRWLEARVPASSHASRRLFQSFALEAQLRYAEMELTSMNCFPAPREPELLLRIGANAPDSRGRSVCRILGAALS